MIAYGWLYYPANEGLPCFHSWTIHNNEEGMKSYWKQAYKDFPEYYLNPNKPHKCVGRIVPKEIYHEVVVTDTDIESEVCMQILQRDGYITQDHEPKWMRMKH